MIGKIVPDHTDRNYLLITITNIGRRPVLVNGWGAIKKEKTKDLIGIFITPHGLPRMLREGEYHTEYTDDLSTLSQDLKKSMYGILLVKNGRCVTKI
ncbi:MAG TPA: hypothetical protein DCE80_08860 [Ignavibacteriales bacterium]|nr:hypothetical protein [Ignavibacteriales bacterium]